MFLLFFPDPGPNKLGSKFYIMLQVANYYNQKVILKPSDGFPSVGFPINPKMVAKIKKEVPRPSQISFTAFDLNGKALLLNGKANASVTPSASPLEFTKFQIREPGKSTSTFTFIESVKIVRYHTNYKITKLIKLLQWKY